METNKKEEGGDRQEKGGTDTYGKEEGRRQTGGSWSGDGWERGGAETDS